MKNLKEAIRDYLALRRGLGFKLNKHSRFLKSPHCFSNRRARRRLPLGWPCNGRPNHSTSRRQRGPPGERGAWICAPLECYGPSDGDPAETAAPVSPQTCQPLHLFRCADPPNAGSCQKDANHAQPPALDVPLPIRTPAVTGLRISEEVNLRSTDVDWSEGILTILNSNFGKSRLIPLHASSLKVLSDYGARRDLLFAKAEGPLLLLLPI
jgi:integrase/recombinase XerD